MRIITFYVLIKEQNLERWTIFSVGEKPETGPAAKIWLSQFFPNYGWAKIWLGRLWLGHFFGWANFFHFLAGPKFGCWPSFGWAKWLGHILAGPILLDRYYGWAILAGLMAGSSIGPAKNLAQP